MKIRLKHNLKKRNPTFRFDLQNEFLGQEEMEVLAVMRTIMFCNISFDTVSQELRMLLTGFQQGIFSSLIRKRTKIGSNTLGQYGNHI